MSQAPVSASHSASIVWFISFGDLLTLLVCFFLVLTPWEKLANPSTSQHQSTDVPASQSIGGNGTVLATPELQELAVSNRVDELLFPRDLTKWFAAEANDEVLSEVPVFDRGASKTSVSVLTELAANLERDGGLDNPGVTRVLVRLCSPTPDVTSSGRNPISGSNVAATRIAVAAAQLVQERGIATGQIALGYPTEGCGDMAVLRPVTAPIVGTVTVIGKRVNVGSKNG